MVDQRATVVSIRDVTVIRETNWAIWCRCQGKEFYIPIDLIHGTRPAVGDTGDIDVPAWFAADNGFV